MKLNQFVSGSADEELLKSLYQTCVDSGKEPSEDLLKAMDKAGLVQVQRTVSSKHGTYTRMQWVKASDVKDSDKVVGRKSSEEVQARYRKEEEEREKKYAGAITNVDRMKIDLEDMEKRHGMKLNEERKKKHLEFAEYLDKKYGNKRIPQEEYEKELREHYRALSKEKSLRDKKQTESKDKTPSDTKSPTSPEENPKKTSDKNKPSNTKEPKGDIPKVGSPQSIRALSDGMGEHDAISDLVLQIRHNGTEDNPATEYNKDDIAKVNKQLKDYCDKHGISANGSSIYVTDKGSLYVERKDGSKKFVFGLDDNRQGYGGWGNSSVLGLFLETRGRAFERKEANSLCRELYGMTYNKMQDREVRGGEQNFTRLFGIESESKPTTFNLFNGSLAKKN